mmetsp:Transcript_39281/g.126227  ORF Transcript_39281/g.126227 Transcript_39281/m.126227 type:complete len:761 (-) Transcript_39281:56-2338(-)
MPRLRPTPYHRIGSSSRHRRCRMLPLSRAAIMACRHSPSQTAWPRERLPSHRVALGRSRSRSGFGSNCDAGGANFLRATSPEAEMRLDGVNYSIGGLVGQRDFAFLNVSELPELTSPAGAFRYSAHRTGAPTARYKWAPGVRHSDASLSWPPRGLTLSVDFVAPEGAPAAHRDVVVTVVYALYRGLPLYEKHVAVTCSGRGGSVVLESLATDVLRLTNEATGYWPHAERGHITGASTSGRVHMASEMTRGTKDPSRGTTRLGPDESCTTCTQGNGALLLRSVYPRGPAAQLGPAGFHGRSFASFRTYVLLHDSDEAERQGLALRRMYRTLAPQVTENPTFLHLTDATEAGIRRAVDQCAAVGFEMIILSFGSGLDMESTDPAYVRSVAASVEYAHSRGIELGGYNLMASSRRVGHAGDCVNASGAWNGAACLASSWSDGYFRRVKDFIEATGLDAIETDGPYEGQSCASKEHAHHRGEEDSAWTQYERNMEFYAWCKERGMYVHAPDPYYFRGINKDGMGYVETNWNLPLWEQITLARQNIYDGTWVKAPSQGWMFVPLVKYHGGWPQCCVEPAGFLHGEWEFYLSMYFATGVSPCYRGTRLYDDEEPASEALVQRYVAFNNKYRTILHADMVHLKRADGNGIDALLHVEPVAAKCRERAMLVVFHQSRAAAINTTLRVPLYYSGLDDVASVSRMGGEATTVRLRRDFSVTVRVEMAPASVAWWVFESPPGSAKRADASQRSVITHTPGLPGLFDATTKT